MRFRTIRIGQLGEGEVVSFAVSELEKHLRLIDPEVFVDILICDAPSGDCGDIIWVGHHEALKADVPHVEDPTFDDAIVVSIQNNAGYITGSNDGSVLLAVYRFLKELGCSWIRPGKDGLRVRKQRLERISVSLNEVPSYRHRGVCIEGTVAEQHVLDLIDYLPKIGMNEYKIQFRLPATFFENWYSHKSNPFAETRENISHTVLAGFLRVIEREISKRGMRYHKIGHGWTCRAIGMDDTGWHRDAVHVIPEGATEIMALINGVRGLKNNSPMDTQLCYSNPVARQKMVDAVVDYAKNNRYVDILHVWDADNLYNHCECENCITKRPMDWFLMFLNELDQQLTAEGLDTRIAFVVSRDKLWAPLYEKLENQKRFLMMFAPITRTFDKHYGQCVEGTGQTTEFKRNNNTYPRKLEDNCAYLRQWKKVVQTDSFLYDYHLIWPHVNDPGYERIARQLYDDMRNLDVIDINGMLSCQVTRCAFPTDLPMQTMAETLWNKHCDYEAIANAYYATAFGPDGHLVRDYLSTISEKFIIMPYRNFGDPENRLYGPFCTDYEGLYKLVEDFRSVIREHADEVGTYQQEWKFLLLHNEFVRRYLRMYELWEQRNKKACKEAGKELFELILRNEDWLHPVLDATNTVYVINRRMGLLDNPEFNDTTGE